VSVLGPLPFTIYTNDISKFEGGNTITYADDTLIINMVINPQELKTATFTNTSQVTVL